MRESRLVFWMALLALGTAQTSVFAQNNNRAEREAKREAKKAEKEQKKDAKEAEREAKKREREEKREDRRNRPATPAPAAAPAPVVPAPVVAAPVVPAAAPTGAATAVTATTSAPQAPAVDPTRFHTTSFYRMTNGEFVIIPAQTRPYQVIDQMSFRPVVDPFTGKPKVLPNEVYLYDSRSIHAAQKTSVAGYNYIILADKTLLTFSTTWDRPLPKGQLTTDIDAYGGNFMIKRGTREIMTVNATGFVNFGTAVIAPATRLIGGSFFIDRNNELWTVDAKGFVYNASKIVGLSYPGAVMAGGNYFYQQDGSLVTIGSDGLPRPAFRMESKPAVLGGNYYIGEDQIVYSVSYEGNSFKNERVTAPVGVSGYSYMILSDKRFLVVDANGTVHLDGVRVNSQRTQYVQSQKIEDSIEMNSVFQTSKRQGE